MKKTIMIRSIFLFLAFLLMFAVGMPIALAASEPTIDVGSAEGKPGDTVTVPITVENNPGIVALRIFAEYNNDVLRLTEATDGTIFPEGKNTFNDDLTANPYTMLWMDGTSQTDYAANGTLVSLTFVIADDAAAGSYPIQLTYDNDSTFNKDLDNVMFAAQNGSVTVIEALYTATFTVDGVAISTKQYHAGDAIVKPADPAKDGYTFKGWMPAVPATMPAQDMTFTAVFEKIPDPVIKIHNYTSSRTVDYRTTITFLTPVVENPVEGAKIHWFIDGQDKGATDTCTVKEAKKDFTVQAKYMKDGKVLAESEIETVKVNAGFFARLKAFFRALFKKLPVIVQEYLGVEIIDRVLP